MSRYDELLRELCPDGVEYKTLGDAATAVRGRRVVKKNLGESGFPVFQNSLTPLGYHSESNVEGGNVFLICAGAAGGVGYSAEPFWAADDSYVFVSNEVD